MGLVTTPYYEIKSIKNPADVLASEEMYNTSYINDHSTFSDSLVTYILNLHFFLHGDRSYTILINKTMIIKQKREPITPKLWQGLMSGITQHMFLQ